MGDVRTDCPQSTILAAYIDHRLSLVERAAVEQHLSSCHECLRVVAGVVRTTVELSDFWPDSVRVEESRGVDRQTVVGLLTAAAAILVVLALPPLLQSALDRDAVLVTLGGGVGEHRSILGRLSGGFPHAPLGALSVGGRNGEPAGTGRILPAAAKTRESIGERETPARWHAIGVTELLAGLYDDAARSLTAAAREQPGNAKYLSDVAALHLERARLGLRPDDLPRALALADRARRLDPSLREAWFNRALALSALSLRDQAKVAWTEYLARDNSSPWAEEARARLGELSKPTRVAAWATIEQQLRSGAIDAGLADAAVRTQMTEARNFIDNELMPAWAVAVERGEAGDPELERLRIMAAAFLRVAGDTLYADAVRAIERAQPAARRRALAKAHRLYSQAAAMFAEDRMTDAAAVFAAVRPDFEKAGSPFLVRVLIELGAIAYVTGRPDEATEQLTTGLAAAQLRGYLSVSGRCAWFQGLLAFTRGQLGAAQSHYEDTLATFERIGDVEQTAAANSLLASLYDYIGDTTLGWKYREAALPILNVSRSPRLRFQVLVSAAGAVRRQDAETSLILQDAVIDAAKALGRPGPLAEAVSQRAEILHSLGRHAEAQLTVADARKTLTQVVDPAIRRRAEVSVLAADSLLARSRMPEEAARSATRAIELLDARRDRRRLAQLHLRLAKANLASGRLNDAESALARGITLFDDERRSLNDDTRVSTIDESWELFDAAVQLAIKRGDYGRAFDLSERARTRTLAESRRGPVRSLKDVELAIPQDQAVLVLNQFDDELAVWVIRHDGTTVSTRPVNRGSAVRLIAQQQDEIARSTMGSKAGAALYHEIVRPAAHALKGISRVVVVPDATYESAAFAALWDPANRRFLIEQVAVTMAPSVSGFVRAQDPPPAAHSSDASLIVIGPESDADDRAHAIASVYSTGQASTSRLTGRQFLNGGEQPRTLHVATRMTLNQAFPMLSRMLLSDEPGQSHSGAVLARDIATRAPFTKALVVLDNLAPNTSRQDSGTLSLARGFIAAGVPAVLGTLPGADGDATRELMVEFHRQLANGLSAEDALSTLQRNVLQINGRRLGAWSALVLYGSER